MISFLFAMGKNQVIGANNDLPWHLPNDLTFFKQKTTGNTIIMGRKTFDSIGRVLPNRRNVVLTRNPDALPAEVEVIVDVETIIKWNEENPDVEYFVIGGGNLFKQLMSYADRMYITLIDEEFVGDTYFPHISLNGWKEISNVKGEKNENNPYDYYYIQYDRIL